MSGDCGHGWGYHVGGASYPCRRCVPCPKCNSEGDPCAYPNGYYKDCPLKEEQRMRSARIAGEIKTISG